MTEDEQRKWISDAHTYWTRSPGHYTLRQAVADTAPHPNTTEDERRETTALCVAYCQTLYEAIMEATYV